MNNNNRSTMAKYQGFQGWSLKKLYFTFSLLPFLSIYLAFTNYFQLYDLPTGINHIQLQTFLKIFKRNLLQMISITVFIIMFVFQVYKRPFYSPRWVLIAACVEKLLLIANSSFNFVIYCLAGKGFRQQVSISSTFYVQLLCL